MNIGTLRAVERTDVGRVRAHNEDNSVITAIANGKADFQLWLVADGMGGGVKGEVASSIARDEMVAALRGFTDWSDPARNLDAAARRANAAVFREGTANGELTRSAMGTTLVAALIDQGSGRYWLVNIGDSRAYVASGGKLRQLTRDHSLIAEQVAAGQLTADEAKTASHRNVITRAVGTDATVEPDVSGPKKLAAGERLLLCSDGLFGMIDDGLIATIVGREELETAADALIAAANDAGGRDNITAVVGAWEGGTGPAAGAVSSERRVLVPVALGAMVGVILAAGAAFMLWPRTASKSYAVPAGESCEAAAGKLNVAEADLRTLNKLGPEASCEGRTLRIPAKPLTAPTTNAQPVADTTPASSIPQPAQTQGGQLGR